MNNTKRLLGIFVWANQAILITGMGLFPVLPLYAGSFGSSTSRIGVFMALVYVAISVGTIASGWLAERFGNRRTYLAAGVTGVLALLLLTQARTLAQANALVALVWFAGGIGLSLNSVFIGLLASEAQRGKAFGLLALTPAGGAILGSLTVGNMVQRGGYGLAFIVLAAIWLTWPLIAALWVPEVSAQRREAGPKNKPVTGGAARADSLSAFYRLMAAALLSTLTISLARMGLSMAMKAQGYTAMDVSNANIVAGLATLPLALGISTLSDRFGRKRMLALTYTMVIAGAMILSGNDSLPGYWVASSLLVAAYGIGSSLASAYATDLLPAAELGRRMPWINTTKWVAGVIGFAISGYSIQLLGLSNAFMASAVLPLAGLGFLVLPAPRLRIRRQAPVEIPCVTPSLNAVPVEC